MELNTENINNLSYKQVVIYLCKTFVYLSKKKFIILLFGILFSIFGAVIAYFRPIYYEAKVSFIIEEGKSANNSLSGLASIAGQFGVDFGNSAGSGILSGDNVLIYLKSPTLAREILLSKFDTIKNESLADFYLRVYKLDRKWSNKISNNNLKFLPLTNGIKYTRVQDSLLQVLTKKILDEEFSVLRPDKKASFINVNVSMRDEVLSKLYCERIVKNFVDKYVGLKVQRQTANVEKLQNRLDSISEILKKKTVSSARLQNSSSLMDINPLFKTNSNVEVESTVRDKALLSTIYASVTQNLEMAKFALSQETPVIQIIDSPMLPLDNNKVSILKLSFLFFVIGTFITIIILVLYKYTRNAIK